MEIYTNDLVDVAIEHAKIISEQLGKYDYIIEDECCNLQRDIRAKIYERLSEAFKDIIERKDEKDFDLEKELYKTINEL
jgi:hypothetical protein